MVNIVLSNGICVSSNSTKQPQLILDESIAGTKTIFWKALTDAMYIVIQLPNGNTDSVKVNVYQSLTESEDGCNTNPETTITFDPSTDRQQKSETVVTIAPYAKIEVKTISDTQIKIWIDYL